ncbi:hypothetical protein V8E36_008027 [Tilletia maclaganii]
MNIDYENIADLRRRFDEAHKIDDKTLLGRVATTLVEQASVHSDGEEMSVYKKLDEKGLHAIAEHDREEHQEVKQAFKAVDDILLSITEPDLAELVRHAQSGPGPQRAPSDRNVRHQPTVSIVTIFQSDHMCLTASGPYRNFVHWTRHGTQAGLRKKSRSRSRRQQK